MFTFPEPMRLCLVGEPAVRAEGVFNKASRMLRARTQLPRATELSSMPAAWVSDLYSVFH